MVNRDNEELKDALDKQIRDAVFDAHAEIVQNTPVDTGRLRNSIVVEETSDGFIIGTRIPYAESVEAGSAPHTIEAKNKKSLKFTVGGKTVFAKKVNHPGTSGHFMFMKGARLFQSKLRRSAPR